MRDDNRLRQMLDEYGALLRRAIATVRPHGFGLEVEDIEQEVRIRVWNLLRRESEVDHPKSYLYRIAVNATLDEIKRVKRRREDSLAEATVEARVESDDGILPFNRKRSSPEKQAQIVQILDRVETCIDRLSDNRQLAVRLHLQGLTTQETADLNGWTEAKARNLTYRGLHELRAMLQREGIEYDAGE
jgi:RNA polymerase sigma-70 factor (ECF subfamily)